MTIFQAFILGIIQGLTEFIPVSSSGHLVLLPELFGWDVQSTSFDISVHAATTLALILFFRKDILNILKNLKKNKNLIRNIILTTIPAAIIGLLFEDTIDELFKDVFIISFMLIAMGLVMLFIDRFTRKNVQEIKDLNAKQSFLIGIFQSIAFVRGTSRSGITLIGGMVQGLTREQAVRYAFLAAIPILTAVSCKQCISFALDGFEEVNEVNLLVGFIASFVSGLVAIRLLLSFLRTNSLHIFGIYRIILGIVILIIL